MDVKLNESQPLQSKSLVSRRDFLKTACLGVSVLVGAHFTIESKNEPYSMAVKISSRLLHAEINKNSNPEELIKSKKLAFIWLFAETARQYGANFGYKKSGEALGHYLYGEGKTLDVSSWLEENNENQVFWESLLFHAFDHDAKEHGNLAEESDKKRVLHLKNSLENGFRFPASVYVTEDYSRALSISTYTMMSDLLLNNDGGFSIQDTHVDLEDSYNWDRTTHLPIEGMTIQGVNIIFQKATESAGSFEKVCLKVLQNLNTDSSTTDHLMDIYSKITYGSISGLNLNVNEYITSLNTSFGVEHDLIEQDMSLLEDVGARPYKIIGTLHKTNKVNISQIPVIG